MKKFAWIILLGFALILLEGCVFPIPKLLLYLLKMNSDLPGQAQIMFGFQAIGDGQGQGMFGFLVTGPRLALAESG